MFHRSIRLDLMSSCYAGNGYIGRPILGKRMGPSFGGETHWKSFIGRDEVVAELRQRLLPSMNKGNVQMVTAVRGWPGVGKTTVAAALAHDQVLASAFPDGLLWASIGQKPDLIGQLDIWARELGGTLLERQRLSVASSEVALMLRE